MMPPPHTTLFCRGKLPHWEVQEGRYFVTVRLRDSLPQEVVLRLREIYQNLQSISPQSEEFSNLQRVYFRMMEKYLNAGSGSCALRDSSLASIVADELQALDDWQVKVPHYSIMPNHWHALIIPPSTPTRPLATIMKRIKGRSGLRISRTREQSGPVWQREWFDHWIRNDTEWAKTIRYIQNNPVKAHLVTRWQDHHWTR